MKAVKRNGYLNNGLSILLMSMCFSTLTISGAVAQLPGIPFAKSKIDSNTIYTSGLANGPVLNLAEGLNQFKEIDIDKSGVIKFKGEAVVAVRIAGEPFNGGPKTAALSLPFAMIKSVEFLKSSRGLILNIIPVEKSNP